MTELFWAGIVLMFIPDRWLHRSASHDSRGLR